MVYLKGQMRTDNYKICEFIGDEDDWDANLGCNDTMSDVDTNISSNGKV